MDFVVLFYILCSYCVYEIISFNLTFYHEDCPSYYAIFLSILLILA